MATHSLGAGTCNFPINMRVEERAIIGRAATERVQAGEFKSVADCLRHWYLRGMELENASAANQIRAIRNTAMSTALALLITAQTAAVLAGMDGGDDPLARRVRSARSVTVAGRRFETEA